MWIVDKRAFNTGVVLSFGFLAVLVAMFCPIFGGRNAFEAADRLFNSIAKGSSNYFPDLERDVQEFQGRVVKATLSFPTGELAHKSEAVLAKAGFRSRLVGTRLESEGDLGRLVSGALEDASAMFQGKGEQVRAKHGLPEKEALFVWWSTLRSLQTDLTQQQSFKEAAFLGEVNMRGVEVGYNFYGIEAMKASEHAGILAFSLVFYLLYTVWWGYAILHVFEGLGLQMKASSKKEY